MDYMIDYEEMIEDARKKGITSEKKMEKSIEHVSELLCDLKEMHPEKYWHFIRKEFGNMFDGHYNEAFALYDVSEMHHKDKMGKVYQGEHWSMKEIMEAGIKPHAPYNEWDLYVALNAEYHDSCEGLKERHPEWSEEKVEKEIIHSGIDFYMKDEDWATKRKVWDYIQLSHKKK